MPQICLKISEPLHQQVLLTMQEMGLDNISDTIRFLLNTALENQFPPAFKPTNHTLQKKATHYTILTYCLMEKFLSTSVKNGQILSDEAHEKAEKLVNNQSSEYRCCHP